MNLQEEIIEKFLRDIEHDSKINKELVNRLRENLKSNLKLSQEEIVKIISEEVPKNLT